MDSMQPPLIPSTHSSIQPAAPSKKKTETREISRYDLLESLHMDAGTFMDSLSQLQALVTESSPIDPRADVFPFRFCFVTHSLKPKMVGFGKRVRF